VKVSFLTRRSFFGRLLQQLQAKVAVEVGVFRGEFGSKLLEEAPALERYYAVDPWTQQPFSDDFWNTQEETQHSNMMNAIKALHAAGGHRAHILQLPSLNASEAFAPHSVDFVFLDGRHDYCSVLADLRVWWPKLRPGGIIAGDDYHPATGSGTAVSWQLCPTGRRHFGGVQQAVDDFFIKQFGKHGASHVILFPVVPRSLRRGNPAWFLQKPVWPETTQFDREVS